jgi:hypothetical protein
MADSFFDFNNLIVAQTLLEFHWMLMLSFYMCIIAMETMRL